MRRFISCLLCIAMLLSALPGAAIQAWADGREPHVINDGYIEVQVSKKNAGFVVKTVEGDLLKKSDNNKKLLFHDDEYDTSFVSYQVAYGDGKVEEYLFGGKYGDSTDPSHRGVTVSQSDVNGPVVATWSVGGLTFLQSISLANEQSNEHGMVSIQLAVENNTGSPVEVKARLLLDTCLGDQDYGYYQVVKEDAPAETITSEQTVPGPTIPMNFYATDNPHNPQVMAYSVNSSTDMPYQVTFGHWNNLASSLFDYTPKGSLSFINPYNEYLTTDSAYALYYDLDSIASGRTKSLVTYYGVYSRHNVPAANSVAVDAVAPLRLELNDSKTEYIRLTDVGVADFAAGVTFENFDSGTAKPLKNAVLSVQTTANIRVLSDSGQPVAGYDYDSFTPMNITYSDVQVGKPITKTLYFEARLNEEAVYEKMTIGVYDVSSTGGQISADHLLGEKVIYILIPGSDGDVPLVNFVSMTPDIIYYSGTRHLYATATNSTLLNDRGNWNLKAYKTVHSRRTQDVAGVDIPHDLITIKDGVMDIALTDDIKLAEGSWFLQLEWTDAAVSAEIVPADKKIQTGPQMYFVVSEDPKYKNDSYGILCVVKYDKDYNPSKAETYIEQNHIEGMPVRPETFTGQPSYRIEAFKNEIDFFTFRGLKSENMYKEILLVIRGEFTAEKYVAYSGQNSVQNIRENTYYSAVSTKILDTTTREYKVDNTVTINGCMDFEGGTMLIYYEDYENPLTFGDSSISVEFDGELLTSEARTSIWKGKSMLTTINQGESYSLMPYDKNGERAGDFQDQTIRLVWPALYGAGQTLAGMVFKLAYGELGMMYGEEYGKSFEMGGVLSFSASLSLSFMTAMPQDDYYEPPVTYWSKIQDIYRFYDTDAGLKEYLYSQDKVDKLFDFEDVEEDEVPEKKGVKAAVMVEDILFGAGKGFIGVHFKVSFAMQNLIDQLPGIGGELEVNTIGDWSFGFEGSMALPTMQMEAKLSFRSHNNIPVPDDIYFYVGGFKPGINIDAAGVVWITGGGGGISNIYDTIFLTQSVPPLKLVLAVSFSIIQVMDGEAKISLSLTGISLSATDLKILGTLEAIKSIYLGLDWYPDFNLQASISVDFFQHVIKGGGYIVLFSEGYKDFFFEIYIYAKLAIPESVPAIGGMTIAGVDLGANNDKIWGGVEILGIGYGITYYWGQDKVHFTTGGEMAKPTYPSLLGQEDIPVYYDEERDRTLYARFGTNITPIGPAQVLESSDMPRLMAAGLKTDPDNNLHWFNLGAHTSGDAAIVQISYDAADLDDAKTKANGFVVKENRDLSGADFPLIRYDGSNIDTANTNVTYDKASKKASCSFTVTDPAHYNKDWYISTEEVTSRVMLYNVKALPKVTTVTGTVNGGNIDLNWSGTSLDGLDTLSFYLTESDTKGNLDHLETGSEKMDAGIVLDVLVDASAIKAGSKSVAIPEDVPSGEYYIKAVYSKEDQVNGIAFSSTTISYTNSKMPGTCTIKSFAPAGNLEYELAIEAGDSNTTGYLVTIYDESGEATDVAGMKYDKAETGDTTFAIGGSYEYEDESKKKTTYGLVGGQSYYAGVTPYHSFSSGGSGEDDTIIYGKERKTGLVALPAQTMPTVTITANKELRKLIIPPVIEGATEKIDAFTESDVTFTAAISEAATGKWFLDESKDTWIDGLAAPAGAPALNTFRGAFANTNSVHIPLTDMTEGDHVLTISGKNGQGDRFKHDYYFKVDTTPPRLMLSSPVNGSIIGKDGKVAISGVTDQDVRITVKYSDGSSNRTIHDEQPITTLDGEMTPDGVFKFFIDIPNPYSTPRHDLEISAADAMGNTVSKNAWVSHGGLVDLEKLEILVNGSAPAGGHIPAAMLGSSQPIALMGITSDKKSFDLSDDSNVSWQCLAMEGSGRVDDEGKLTLSSDARGMVAGKLEVATGAYRTAVLSFGEEAEARTVKATSTAGGSVTGAGTYTPGRSVTLRATPGSGYAFAGWTISGVSVENTGLSTITFVMPGDSDVTAYAEFVARKTGGAPSLNDPGTVTSTVTAQAGDLVEVPIPFGADPNTFVTYYINGAGNRTFVPLSVPVDGKLYFVAPVDGAYYFVDNRIAFRDAIDHWAESAIGFMTARGLFKGVGGNRFEPDAPMTRAMLVSVLHRLAGGPNPDATAPFTDVVAGDWYARSVAWGYENGIVSGVGGGRFAPDQELTRDQLCALLVRFIRLYEVDLPALTGDLPFIDTASIPDWALDDVAYCRALGLVGGYPDGRFQPDGKATRAENSTVLMKLIEVILKGMIND